MDSIKFKSKTKVYIDHDNMFDDKMALKLYANNFKIVDDYTKADIYICTGEFTNLYEALPYLSESTKVFAVGGTFFEGNCAKYTEYNANKNIDAFQSVIKSREIYLLTIDKVQKDLSLDANELIDMIDDNDIKDSIMSFMEWKKSRGLNTNIYITDLILAYLISTEVTYEKVNVTSIKRFPGKLFIDSFGSTVNIIEINEENINEKCIKALKKALKVV